MYVAGYSYVASNDNEWRIEKRNMSDGSLTTTNFGLGSALADQNAAPSLNSTSTPIRLRMNVIASSTALDAFNTAFKLQFSTATSSGWTDVGAGQAWRFYDEPTASSGLTLPSVVLSSSAIEETYEEQNPTAPNPNAIPVNQAGEWDFSLNPTGAANAAYYFRMVKSDDTTLDAYSRYPSVTISTGHATVSSAANQTFFVGQATTTASAITIVAGSGAIGAITSANDIRVRIASSSVNMRWDTTLLAATLSGSAVASTSATVSYPDTYTLLLNVTSEWLPGGDLTISNLAFTNFGSSTDATSSLYLYIGGAADQTIDAIDDKWVAIYGSAIISNTDSGQQTNVFSEAGDSLVGANLFRLKLISGTQTIKVKELSIDIFDSYGFVGSDITNPTLCLDINGNGVFDAGEPEVDKNGKVSLSGTTGEISFNSSWTVTSTRDIIMKADVSNLVDGDYLTLSILSYKLKIKDAGDKDMVVSNNTVSNAKHGKPVKARGGGGGAMEGGSPYGGFRGGGTAGGGEGGEGETPGGGGAGGGGTGGGGGEAP